MSLFDLTGKVAVITGSSKGIGRAIAERMAEHGAKVVISSRKSDACEAVARGIRDQGGEAIVVPCHIARKEELQALVDRTIAHWGGIDVLVCNAAVNPYLGPATGASDEVYERIMGANVRSNFWLCNMVLPQMAERGGGVDHHHLLDRRPARLGAAWPVRDLQGRRHAARAQHLRRVGTEEHPRQHDRARPDTHGFRPRLMGEPGAVPQAHARHAAATHRRAGRDRRGRGVSGVPGGQLRHRPHAGDRRRHDDRGRDQRAGLKR